MKLNKEFSRRGNWLGAGLHFLAVAFFVIAAGVGVGTAQTGAMVNGNTQFAMDLYGQLKGQPGNLFFSPHSISTALCMTWGGAKGETAKQMSQVLHLLGDPADVHSSFGKLQQQLAAAGQKPGVELHFANALWAQQGHPFLPTFLGDTSPTIRPISTRPTS